MSPVGHTGTARPSVSVVIPTLNAADRIRGLLLALRRQTLAPTEILVVDSASMDGTADVAADFDGVAVQVIDRGAFDHGLTRHDALMATTGDIVCYLTDDAVPVSDSYLEKLVAPLQDESVALAYGRQLPRPDARRFERLVRERSYGSEAHVRVLADVPTYGVATFFASDVCSAYRRSSYLEVGGFGACETNEDMLIAARLIARGYAVAYAAEAEVMHSHNLTLADQFARNRLVGRFLEMHSEDLLGASELGAGMRVVTSVLKELLSGGHVIESGAFIADCAARFAGNRLGRREGRRQLRATSSKS